MTSRTAEKPSYDESHVEEEQQSEFVDVAQAATSDCRQTGEGTSNTPLPDLVTDRGFWAWAATLGGHLVLMNTWGFNTSFGVFQTYYTTLWHEPPDKISFIGSIQIFCLFFVGTVAGRFTDAGYFRSVTTVGGFFTCLGVFMTSVSKAYWQLFLAQGVCIGLGNGLLFTPSLTIVAQHFIKKRALAFGITATGTATGGLIFPAMARQLLPKIGIDWTIRSIGLVQVITLIVAMWLLRPQLPPRSSGPLVDISAFKELEYTFFASGMFCAFWGMYFAFYYIASFATSELQPKMDYISALNLLLVVNGIGYVGRLTPNLFADKLLGPITLMIPLTVTAGVYLLAWMAVTSEGQLYAWAVIYGIAAGGIQSLFPPSLTSLTSDMSKNGVRMGMVCTTNSIATLTGPLIMGALIRVAGGSWVGAQAFAGGSVLLAAGFFVAARVVRTHKLGRGWKVNV